MTDRATEQARYALAYRDPEYRMGIYRQCALQHWLWEQVRFDGPVSPKSYLDVGCGRGESLGIAEQLGIYWADGAEIRGVASTWPLLLAFPIDGVHALQFGDREYDLVTCLDVLEHVSEVDALQGLRELIRVTRRRLLISVAWHSHVHNGVELHILRRDAEWWKARLLEACDEFGARAKVWVPPVEMPAEKPWLRETAWFEVVR